MRDRGRGSTPAPSGPPSAVGVPPHGKLASDEPSNDRGSYAPWRAALAAVRASHGGADQRAAIDWAAGCGDGVWSCGVPLMQGLLLGLLLMELARELFARALTQRLLDEPAGGLALAAGEAPRLNAGLPRG